ncbi:MAG: hypothetical protein RIT26_1720 [Pseudomonadota bacterium]
MQKIIILGTGGTIAGLAPDPQKPDAYASAQLGVEGLFTALGLPVDQGLEFEQVAQLDSKDADEGFWRRLLSRVMHHLQRPEVAGLVLTHGTDTMEETAFLLSSLLPLEKPVALTGAMRAANHPRTDGPANLRDALHAVKSQLFRGVAVIMDGHWWAGSEVRKVKASALDAWATVNPDAHGRLEVLTPGQGRFMPQPVALRHWPTAMQVLSESNWPRVELWISHGGAQEWVLQAMRMHPHAPPLRGLVLAGTGAGTWHHRLTPSLHALQNDGVRCWVSTRCALDQLPFGVHEGIQSVPYSPAQARLGLMLALISEGR